MLARLSKQTYVQHLSSAYNFVFCCCRADCSAADMPHGSGPIHNGLTPFGKTVIKEMNRLGMIIDLSHSSHKTSVDTIATSQAPVIFSHSSAAAICNSTRNVRDDILKMVVRTYL